jgi:hypothetical protein
VQGRVHATRAEPWAQAAMRSSTVPTTAGRAAAARPAMPPSQMHCRATSMHALFGSGRRITSIGCHQLHVQLRAIRANVNEQL